jgi:hypothetical protein
MIKSIKPIETKYKGYRFRSRLEARWAVFFDTLDIKWEYEPEGFDLEGVGYYLPDFYLPKFDVWAEVKPSDEFKTREESLKTTISVARRCVEMLKTTHGNFMYLKGLPENKPYLISWLSENGIEDEMVCFHTHSTGNLYSLRHGNPECCKWDDVELAAIAARSARFEHGETP